MLCDTHCHLNFDNFDMDREEVLTRAKAAGVIRILNPGVDEATSHQAVEYTQDFPEVFAAAGIHPNSAQSWSDHSLVMLQELAANEKVVAIGEIGLDYYRNLASKLLQQQIFSYQLALAAEMDLPVIIHIRDSSEDDRSASQDALEILGDWHHELEAAQLDPG